MTRRLLLFAAILATSCTSPVEDYPMCTDEASDELPEISEEVTWHQDVRPIVEGRCVRCHRPGEIGPMPLTTYDEVFAVRGRVLAEVQSGRMPPWLPADCCNEFEDDFDLTAEQVATIETWVDRGAPEGNPDEPGEPLEEIGGLSRVDVTVEMEEAYTPQPDQGRVDDFRCFAIDWPLEEETFITGINPKPGARSIVHHLIIAVASGDDAEAWEELESSDGRPGIPCEGGFGDMQITTILGGSLTGSDFPDGLGKKISPDSKIILNVHYSMASSPAIEDKTTIEFKTDDEATDFNTLPITNPAWLVSDAMSIPAGESNVVYRFQFNPGLFTRGEQVYLRGFTPHMHELGTKIRTAVIRDDDDSKKCLTEIPRWNFGWEQPYWFAEAIPFEPGDELYLECHYDNTRSNQPIVDGKRQEPRDVAWGTDFQDMCAGFVQYTFEE